MRKRVLVGQDDTCDHDQNFGIVGQLASTTGSDKHGQDVQCVRGTVKNVSTMQRQPRRKGEVFSYTLRGPILTRTDRAATIAKQRRFE